MEPTVIVAMITSGAVIITAIITAITTHHFSRKRDIDTDWRKSKLEHYREFLAALSSIVGTDATPEGHRRFAHATNTLHLIASEKVVMALHAFRDEISLSNSNPSRTRHDKLLSDLIKEIRIDLGLTENSMSDVFPVRLYTSGIQANQ